MASELRVLSQPIDSHDLSYSPNYIFPSRPPPLKRIKCKATITCVILLRSSSGAAVQESDESSCRTSEARHRLESHLNITKFINPPPNQPVEFAEFVPAEWSIKPKPEPEIRETLVKPGSEGIPPRLFLLFGPCVPIPDILRTPIEFALGIFAAVRGYFD